MRFRLLRPPVISGRLNSSAKRILALLPFLFLAAPLSAADRFIPDDVSIQAFAKPTGQHLQLLVRVPAIALNEIQFPMRPGGNTDLERAESMLPGVARYWIADSIDIEEDGVRLAKPRVASVRIAPPADHSFASFDDALAHLTTPRPPGDLDMTWGQTRFDVLLDYAIHSDRAGFVLHPHFARLGARVSTDLTFLAPDAPPRTFQYTGDPNLVRLNPGVSDVVAQFFRWGFGGAIVNTDYLLLVLCLILPLRRFRDAATVAAGFLFAGAITLFAAAAGMATDGLWFTPLIQTLVAVAILVVASQNMAGGVRPLRRALEASVFGLLYGFDFSFGLAAKVQYAGAHTSLAAVCFGAGTVLALLVAFLAPPAVLRLLFHFTQSERMENIVLSLLAAHAAWHWMTERWDRLSRFSLHAPAIDTAFLALAMRWMMILVIFGGIVWFAGGWLNAKQAGENEAA